MNFAATALGGYLLITLPIAGAAQAGTLAEHRSRSIAQGAPAIRAMLQTSEPWVAVEAKVSTQQVRQLWMTLVVYGSAVGLAVTLIWNRYLRNEIRQRRVAEARLQVSEERYATLAKAIPVGVFRTDAAGDCTYVNERWCQMTGLLPEMATGVGWQQMLHREDRARVAAEWAKAVRESRPAQIEYRIQRSDGKVTWVYAQSAAERDTSGQVVGYVGSITDIDGRKRSEKALQQSEAQQRALISVLPDLIMRISRAGVFLEFLASPNFLVLGDPVDWIGSHISKKLPELAEERLAAIRRVLETRTIEIYEQEFFIEGKIQFEEVRVVPYGEDEVLFLVRDMSDRKRAELALRKSEAQSQAILNAIPDYLVRVGIDGRYREFASPDRDFAISSRAGLVGRSLAEVLPGELANQHMYYLRKALQTGELQVFEQTVRVGDRLQEEEVRVVKSHADEVLLIIRDIGDRKRAETALQRKLQKEKVFSRVVQTIRNSLDLTTIFAAAATEIAQLLPGLNCSIVQYLPERGIWKIIDRVCSDPDLPSWVGFEVSDTDNPFADQLKQLQIVRVEDTREIDNISNQPAAQSMPGAWLMIPLVVDNKVWASLSLSISQQPFHWEDELVDLLRAIADQLEVAIQQARLYQQVEQEKQKLIKSQKALTQAQQMAEMGNWEFDVATQAATWSDNMFRIFGLEIAPAMDAADVMQNHIHPEDRAQLEQMLHCATTQGIPYEIDLRFFRADGSMGYLESRGEAVRDQHGQIVKIFGTSLDITHRKQAEAKIANSEVRYRRVVEAQTDFILRSLPDTTITFANSSLCKALGISPEELVGKKWSYYASPVDLEENVVQPDIALSPEQPRRFEENRNRRANGQIGWTQWLDEGIFDEAGQLVEIQSVGRDITPLKQAEQALRESEERLRLVTENMSDLVCLHHPDGRYLYITPSSQTLLGYSPAELIGRDPYTLFHPEDCDRIRQSHQLVLKGITNPMTYRIRQQTGDYIWLETLTQPIFDQQGQLIHLQTTSREVSDRIKAEEQLRHDSLHDSLTGLPNRTLLLERLDLSLRRATRHKSYQFAVLFLDLDNFKVINDSLGHLIGDELLLKTAALLSQMIRETDLAARLGGDEFVVLLDGLDEAEEAVRVTERILAGLETPLLVANREIFIGASIGIVVGATGYQCAEELLRDSDLAMYRAKHSGRGCYVMFDPDMHLKAVQRLQIESDLRKALEHSQFVLYYQPVVDLKSQTVRGFEALIRWQHPQKGCVSPADFIEIAEETGLIEPIGEWVLHSACRQLALWQAQFPQRILQISVNLSVKQLKASLLQTLEDVLTAYCIQPHSLVLEITESMLVENIGTTVKLLKQIKAKGIHISIDDFGTGYSSLSYLHQLPIDVLKIDRAFVSPAEPDARNQVIAESIIALSNLLELNVIAEGIETAQQLAWLQMLGCESGQGYFFSPPVLAEQAAQMLTQPAPKLDLDGRIHIYCRFFD